MREVIVGLGSRQYPITIGCNVTQMLGERARAALPDCKRLAIVSHPGIYTLHGDSVRNALVEAGFTVDVVEIPEGENHKTVASTEKIWDFLIRGGHTRQSALLALGGGVVGDICGFAAATFMRGVPFIQAPTTLLAMVDSSVGGKTGVNHPLAKNMIGAFWQPRLVFMDLAFLQTLPVEEFRSGFAEVIKHGIIRDASYFAFLESHHKAIFALEPEPLAEVVAGSCEIKADVVARDEREGGLRAILNYGHTVGHAIEALAEYGNVRHGEAVAEGMVAAARIGEQLNMISADLTERVIALLKQSGLPVTLPDLAVGDILDRLQSDKKVRDGKVRFVLPTQMGEVTIRDDVPREIIRQVLLEMGART